MKLQALFVSVLLITSVFSAFGQGVNTWNVNPNSGEDSPNCGTEDAPCLSLGYTLSLYLKGTDPLVIRLFPGVYSGLTNTQISLSGTGPAIRISSVDVGVIFDFQNQTGWKISSYSSNLLLESITFTHMQGLGLSFSGSAPQQVTYILSGCTFDNNYFFQQGVSEGLDVSIGSNTFMIIDKCTFKNHNYQSDDALNWSYGPLVLRAGIVQVQECVFLNNTGRIGPLTILNTDDVLPPLDVIVNSCTFRYNLGLESASIYSRKIRNTIRVDLSNLQIDSNIAYLSIITISEGLQIISNSNINDNNLLSSQGAVYIEAHNNHDSQIVVKDCNIIQNVAKESDDGNLYAAGLACNGVRLYTIGTIIIDNMMGNVNNNLTQISCLNCPGCIGPQPPSPPSSYFYK